MEYWWTQWWQTQNPINPTYYYSFIGLLEKQTTHAFIGQQNLCSIALGIEQTRWVDAIPGGKVLRLSLGDKGLGIGLGQLVWEWWRFQVQFHVLNKLKEKYLRTKKKRTKLKEGDIQNSHFPSNFHLLCLPLIFLSNLLLFSFN